MKVSVFAHAHQWDEYNLMLVLATAAKTPHAGHLTRHDASPGTLQQTFVISHPVPTPWGITIHEPNEGGPL